MIKKTILASLLLLLSLSCFCKSDDRILSKVSFQFAFIPGSDILETHYSYNGYELKKLYQFLKYNLYDIKNGSSHLSIISHIKVENKDDLQTVNRASILGSVVRAHLKMKYGLSDRHFSFYISCEEVSSDQVTVAYKPYPLKAYDNQDIYYTQKTTYNNLLSSIIKYRTIPYLTNREAIDQVEKVSFPDFPVSVSDSFKSVSKDSSTVTETFDIPKLIDSTHSLIEDDKRDSEKNIVFIFSGNGSTESKNDFSPVLGFSTNLLKFFGVSPLKMAGTLPNISLEYYFANKYSLKLEGSLTPLNSYLLSTSEGTWWKSSALSLEGRFWPVKGGSYGGLYAGLFGLYGDFDIKDSLNDIFGATGDFYGAGLSVGYSLRICDWLSIEAGMRGLYRVDKCSIYEVRDDGFFLNNSYTRRGFYIHDFNLSIVLRYGLKK